MMNQLLPSYNMNWKAANNEIVALYYEQKRKMWGDGYNLYGFDYYKNGIFEFLSNREYPKVNPYLVRSFDWRNRHGANNPLSPYWDGDTLGTGWLTSVKDQGNLGTCWAFCAAGLVEVIVNLFANDTLDYDLSEQNLISCSDAGDCEYGGNGNYALGYVEYPGIVFETCFPYDSLDCSPDSCDNICDPPRNTIKIHDVISGFSDNQDSIRLAILNYGPITSGFGPIPGITEGNHAVIFIGYDFDNIDSTVTWIIKNSWGIDSYWGVNGFCTLKLSSFIDDQTAAIQTPVKLNNQNLPVNCWDRDNDKYYYWGIGEKPANCPTCYNIKDCDDTDSLVGGYDENFNCTCLLEMDSIPHHITSDSTWSDTTYVNYKVIVDSGTSLTITTYAAFAPEAKIVVKQGARLIIDGGYLTKACPDLWQGIEAWGSDTAQGFDKYFGHVIVQNNSIIEFAKNAITNYCTDCGYLFTQSGGMINADSSIFRNNETDVQFAPFQNMWLGKEYPYYSYFTKCQFVTTNDFYPDFLPKVHIDLKDVYCPMFYGCTFENTSSAADYPYPIRGTGISAIDANFSLLEYCNTPNVIPCNDTTKCQFDGLEYGIKALNSRSVRTQYIRNVNFVDNYIGISLSGIDYASICSNDFKCPTEYVFTEGDRFFGGLFMEGCTGYHIEDNYFHGETGTFGALSDGYGIGVKNSGPENNEIYGNQFLRMNTGIIVSGENRHDRDSTGLCLKCNKMDFNNNDFVIVEDTNTYFGDQGIRLFQGNPDDTISITSPAGNMFSDMPHPANNNLYYNYKNEVEDIWYIHHSINNQYIVIPKDSNYTHETIELHDQHTQFDKPHACPSGLGGGQLKNYIDPSQNIFEADNHILLLTNQLNSLVDAGNSEELNFNVMTSFPDDGLEIRKQLLDASPYLSDTVLKQAIYKEDVLPNAMIRDVMEANPQSAKSDEVLNTLNSRFEPMPYYMIDQIMEGKNHFGAKELLEAEIQSWKQIRAKAKYELMREFLLDTNIVNPIDSVIDFLETENDLNSKYDLTFFYCNKGDSTEALSTLDNIPLQFDFDEDQSSFHQYYIDFFGILQQMEDQHWRACDMDSLSVQNLFYIMDEGNVDISAHARGLLVKGGFLNYRETLSMPVCTKSVQTNKHSIHYSTENLDLDYLRLFPNPSGDYVIICYDVENMRNEGIIKISDLKGRIIRQFLLTTNKNQIIVNTTNLPEGIYFVALYCENKLLDVEKLCKGGN